MKVKLKAHRLDKADVAYLSLVERGANRSPFKVMKTDRSGGQAMIDLSRAFKSDGAKQAQIVGYAIQKTDRSETIDAGLKAAGVTVDKVVEFDDGSMVYKQDDSDLNGKDIVPVRMDDDFVLLVKGFDPYSVGNSMGFDEIIKSQGFMPGLSMGMDALGTTIRTALSGADSAEDAVSKIEDALEQFSDYAAKLAGSIPSTAFKALESFRKTKAEGVVLKGLVKPADMDQAAWDKMPPKDKMAACQKADDAAKAKKLADDKAKEEQDKAQKAAADARVAKEAALNEGEKAHYAKLTKDEDKAAFLGMDAAKRAEAMKPVQKTDSAPAGAPDVGAQIAAAMEKAATGFAATISKAMEPVQKSVADLGSKVDAALTAANEAKALAQKNEKVLKGTVLGGAQPDPEEGDDGLNTRKSDEGMGLIDTGFMSVRKREHNTGVRRTGFGGRTRQ